MKEETIKVFYSRIDRLTIASEANFGKMNAHQMICHCADFFRMANGEKTPEEYGGLSPDEIKVLAKSGKSVPAPKGFGQVEGVGTGQTTFENDKQILRDYIREFSKLPKTYDFATHPYFGKMDYKRWMGLAAYHLDHHLKQFGV